MIITETLIYIANLGDCRALYRKYYGFEVLTTDHDAINEEERVIKAGGFIKDGRVNGILIVICFRLIDSSQIIWRLFS